MWCNVSEFWVPFIWRSGWDVISSLPLSSSLGSGGSSKSSSDRSSRDVLPPSELSTEGRILSVVLLVGAPCVFVVFSALLFCDGRWGGSVGPSGIIGDRWDGIGASDEGGTSGWGSATWTWTDAVAFGSTVGPKSLVSLGIVLSTDGRCSDCCRSRGLIQLDFGDCKSSVNF